MKLQTYLSRLVLDTTNFDDDNTLRHHGMIIVKGKNCRTIFKYEVLLYRGRHLCGNCCTQHEPLAFLYHLSDWRGSRSKTDFTR